MTTDDDDDDISAMFRARRERSMQKRANNREFSTQLLTDKGIPFTSHNAGVHLIVAEKWNFWPGTGLWAERKGKPGRPPREGRGVHKLIHLIEEGQSCSQR